MYLAYEPKKGDVVWLDFNPQTGHEPAGRRPALVLTPLLYNKKVGLAVFCPITSKIKDYPFVVVIPDNLKIKGAILSDQVKSFDWRARKAEFICKLPEKLLKEVKEKLRTLLE